ncbi:MAG TPA: PAS domain S-box protein [Dehalococcoidia bacterium]|nr:PAS domain S-box protein [Dehalococcoidia bacterium]
MVASQKSNDNNRQKKAANSTAKGLFSKTKASAIRPEVLLDNLPEVVYIYDRTDSKLLFVSNAIRDYGYAPEDLLSRPYFWRELISAEDRLRMRPTLESGAETGNRMRMQYMFRAADGNLRTVSDSIQIDTDQRGHIIFSGIMSDVSESQRIKRTLEETESRLRVMVQTLPIILYSFDARGAVTLAEGKGLESIGFRPADVIGKSIFDLFEGHPQIPEAGRRSLSGEEFTSVIDLNGALLETHFSPVKAADGTIEEVWGIAFDVTELKRAQQELEDTRQQMQNILESLDKVFFSTDPANNHEVLYVSPACEHIYGISQEDFYKDPHAWRRVVHPADIHRIDESLERLANESAHNSLEYRILRPDGEIIWVDRHIKPIIDETGKVVRIDGVVSDITERKRTEEALRESEERFRRLFEESPLGISIVGRDFRFLDVNNKFCEMLGYTREELKALTIIDITHPEEAETQAEMSRLSFEGMGPPSSGEKRFYKKTKEIFWATRTATIIRDQNGNFLYAIAMVQDISERKLQEEEMVHLNQEIARERQAIEDLNRTLEQKVHERTEELRRSYVELQDRNRELMDARTKATSDGLTGLRNHRAFQERVRQLVIKAEEEGNQVGLVMLDIDEFKRVNDNLGHQAGDDILKLLSLAIDDLMESEDAYRYGGDEFAVILYGKSSREAAMIAEEIRASAETRLQANGQSVTVSLGVASYPETADSVDKLIYGADAAMYWAKSAGKNRVGIWQINSREGLMPVTGGRQGPVPS